MKGPTCLQRRGRGYTHSCWSATKRSAWKRVSVETDLVELQIDTGDASPIKQQVRRMPFAVRQEVARQLREMQRAGVIRPSNSPRASPVVLVRKKDGSLRFCIDFRALNSIAKPDIFPLPSIDDLLDQFRESKAFLHP